MTTRRLVLTWGRIDDNGNLRKHIADRNDGIILGKPAREGGGVVTGCNLEQGAGIPIGRVASPFRVKPLDPPAQTSPEPRWGTLVDHACDTIRRYERANG